VHDWARIWKSSCISMGKHKGRASRARAARAATPSRRTDRPCPLSAGGAGRARGSMFGQPAGDDAADAGAILAAEGGAGNRAPWEKGCPAAGRRALTVGPATPLKNEFRATGRLQWGGASGRTPLNLPPFGRQATARGRE